MTMVIMIAMLLIMVITLMLLLMMTIMKLRHWSVDGKKVTAIVLLDLSKVFDYCDRPLQFIITSVRSKVALNKPHELEVGNICKIYVCDCCHAT